MAKEVSVLWGLVSIKNGADLPIEQRAVSPVQFPFVQQGMSFMVNGEPVVYFDTDNTDNITKALTECPPVSYIINKLASAFCNGKIIAVNQNTKNPVQGFKKEYQAIIDRPNYLQNDTSFRKQIYCHVKAYGYCVVLKIKPAGFEKLNSYSSLWALPNALVVIEWKRNIDPTKQLSILDCIEEIKFDGIILKKEDIYIFTDDTPYEDGLFIPTSRLKCLKVPINNLIINYTARGKMMNSPMGIFSNPKGDSINTIPLKESEKVELQRDFNRYGMGEKQFKYIITNAGLQWQQMGFPIAQMQFDVFEKNDTITISETLGYPSFLLGLADKGIYNNVSEAKQALYNETIIPDATNYCQQLQECLHSIENGVAYIADFSHVPALQRDKKFEAETRKLIGDAVINEYKNDVITKNRMLELLGEPLLPEVEGNKYYSQTQPPPNETKVVEPPKN